MASGSLFGECVVVCMPVYCMCLYIILDASQAATCRALHKRVFVV